MDNKNIAAVCLTCAHYGASCKGASKDYTGCALKGLSADEFVRYHNALNKIVTKIKGARV